MNSEGTFGEWTPNPGHKIQPSTGYPPEEGRYLRGNDMSPVAVCVILKWREDEIPKDIEDLVRLGVETGAALSGTLQTENIGTEKMICNIVANPNIRYLVVCGPESPESEGACSQRHRRWVPDHRLGVSNAISLQHPSRGH
jgi:tetrahydromethanopterin S-methyltransferase subunit A